MDKNRVVRKHYQMAEHEQLKSFEKCDIQIWTNCYDLYAKKKLINYVNCSPIPVLTNFDSDYTPALTTEKVKVILLFII